MNTMVVRKLFDGFKHMTYKKAQQIESMSTFQNLVWHEFNYPYAWSSVQILQCTPNWNIDIKSRTIYIQMLFLAPPPPHTNATYFLYRSIFLS